MRFRTACSCRERIGTCRGPLIGVAVVAALMLMGSADAGAAGLGLTSFRMEAVAGTTLINQGKGPECEPCRIENVPYSAPFTAAGGHPWGLASTFVMEHETLPDGAVVPTRDPKDISVDLPVGLLGNPTAAPTCPLATVIGVANGHEPCPADTELGSARLVLFGGKTTIGPIVNVTPEEGQSAEFALENSSGLSFLLTAHLVRTADGYGVTVVDNGVPSSSLLTEAELTFWGVPADPSHDVVRGLICETIGVGQLPACKGGGERAGVAATPFLTLPTDCAAGPGTATIRADSWEEPGRVLGGGRYEGYTEQQTTMPSVTGCDLLRFEPLAEVIPDTLLADEPVGLDVTLKVPQSTSPRALAPPQLRDAVVTLPQGVSVSPGVVDGIAACDESGPEGMNFTGPESEEVGLNGELQLAPGHCPDASIVGSAEAITPLLNEPVKGHVYLARPGCGAAGQPACGESDALDGNLYKLYLELGGTGELAKAGVNIKVAGEVEADPATGQLTTRFLGNPQLPFSELRVRLNGGPRAPLANPAVCGPALTTLDLTPWSARGETPQGTSVQGTPDGTPSSFFEVGGCSSPTPFIPGFAAGTVTPQAGGFSTFTLNLGRQDREQYLKGIQVRTPPGLLGMLSSVPLCGEPAAAEGHCPEASKIGTTHVASGAGSHPFEIGGNVYLTTGYKGAPFGLSIVTDAVAGPFNLGLVVVRARIDVDPVTSQLTVTSDPLPQIVFGVPLRLQRIAVNIDRPGFMFNPTNCSGQTITATLSGSQGATANVSRPFAVGGCKTLEFQPQFKVSTSGKTSKADGASLDSKLSFPAGPPGSSANIAYVKVSLPKQLPSRLVTLQKACRDSVFNVNPAACPAASIIGIARTTTPVLPTPLAGPVYFVAHGGEAFPSLVVVQQGDGVRVDLTGTTFISKAGITSTTFKTVPDVPFNTFELYLPEGPFSALAAHGDLCSQTYGVPSKHTTTSRSHGHTVHHIVSTVTRKPGMLMPTEFRGQNGAVFRQNAVIQTTGCTTKPKVKAKHGTLNKGAGRH